MQMSLNSRSPIALMLTAALLIMVVAGALMLTCAEEAQAVIPSSAHAGGSACLIHEGHLVSDAVLAVEPERSTTFDPAASPDVPTPWLASSDIVETSSVLAAPLYVPDPLYGRLLL